mmetsp:Transcript_10849/g.16517  ORF Transcript_10849/g.16517 Transcript_10849/m.16517 type:complete len:338 (+) Transcript_10849:63-1076(+)
MKSSVYAPVPDSLEEVQAQRPVQEVHIDGLAVLKIVKHCNDNLPNMVTGSLLGLDVDGVLEVTYSFPFPTTVDADGEGAVVASDGQNYQIEMMKMLRDVNMDNNCVGWYQSTNMGAYCTSEAIEYQYGYQSSDDLSDSSVVIFYDPIQSKHGHLEIKAFRLSEEYMQLRRTEDNNYVKPTNILVELPVKIKNSGHIAGFLRCLQDTHREELSSEFDPLTLSGSDSYAEKHLERMVIWTDDAIKVNQEFGGYSRRVAKARQEQIRWLSHRIQDNAQRIEDGEDPLPESLSELKPVPPPKIESSVVLGQLGLYTSQLNQHVDGNFEKLFAISQMYSSSK